MCKRIITAVIGLAVLLPLLWFSHTYIFVGAIALVAVIGMAEMMRCIGVHKHYAITIPLYLIAAALPFAARLIGSIPSFGSFALFLMIGYLFYLFAYTVLAHGKINFAQCAEIFVTGLYIALSFSAIVMLRDHGEAGKYIYLIVFMAAWVTDSFAYICGSLFGRHKLIPAISPHKTVEGSVGGILFCMLSMILYGGIVSVLGGPEPNYVFLAVSGLILSVCAQIGDLIASLIKREHGIKDYGKLFPGHGGVMDRFDSTAAVSVVLLVICALPAMGLFQA